MAASPPPRTFDLQYRADPTGLGITTAPVIARTPSAGIYDVAPTPNRDVHAPSAPAASNEAYLSPNVITRARQNRGEGFLAGSTAQEEQDRRAMPGAGFAIKMPLQQ